MQARKDDIGRLRRALDVDGAAALVPDAKQCHAMLGSTRIRRLSDCPVGVADDAERLTSRPIREFRERRTPNFVAGQSKVCTGERVKL